mgnify:CR=1 FL=1
MGTKMRIFHTKRENKWRIVLILYESIHRLTYDCDSFSSFLSKEIIFKGKIYTSFFFTTNLTTWGYNEGSSPRFSYTTKLAPSRLCGLVLWNIVKYENTAIYWSLLIKTISLLEHRLYFSILSNLGRNYLKINWENTETTWLTPHVFKRISSPHCIFSSINSVKKYIYPWKQQQQANKKITLKQQGW